MTSFFWRPPPKWPQNISLLWFQNVLTIDKSRLMHNWRSLKMVIDRRQFYLFSSKTKCKYFNILTLQIRLFHSIKLTTQCCCSGGSRYRKFKKKFKSFLVPLKTLDTDQLRLKNFHNPINILIHKRKTKSWTLLLWSKLNWLLFLQGSKNNKISSHTNFNLGQNYCIIMISLTNPTTAAFAEDTTL